MNLFTLYTFINAILTCMRPFMCLEMRALSVDFLAARVITPVHFSPLEALVVGRTGYGHGSIEQGRIVPGQQGHARKQAAGPVDQRRSTLLKVLLHMRDGSGRRDTKLIKYF